MTTRNRPEPIKFQATGVSRAAAHPACGRLRAPTLDAGINANERAA
jgi:hypothetical protein